MKNRIFAALVLAIFFHHPAEAASFDCSVSKSKLEKVICDDPTLSALDSKLAQLYGERRSLLSPVGAEMLKTSQRSWLHFADLTCAARKVSDYEGPGPCLRARYTERLDQLASAGLVNGPFRFNRIDFYSAKAVHDEDDNTGSSPGFFIEHVAYPQIDNARSAVEVAWNKRNIRVLGKCEDCDEDTDFEIGYATDRFISLRWTTSSYGHGAAHGLGSDRADNVVLQPALRAVSVTDIFGDGQQWVQPLQVMFWSKLTASGWKPPTDSAQAVKTELVSDFIKPDRWFFTKEGLQVSFDSYDGGCYACTPRPVTLSWADVKALLPANSVVP